MGIVLELRRRRHARASAVDLVGRGIPEGHARPEGQLSENQRIVRSSRRTWMSAPPSMAPSFFESPNARQLTVESSRPSADAYVRAIVSNCSMPSMPPISVKLLPKSTAFLLRDHHGGSGYSTGMWTAKEILVWIDRRKKALGIPSDAAVERLAKKSSIVQNLRKTVRNGRGSIPKIAGLKALAAALQDWPSEIFGETSPLDGTPSSDLERLRAEQAMHRQKEEEHRRKAEAIEIAIEVLERKAG